MKNIIHGLGSVVDLHLGSDPELWSKLETDDVLVKAWESVGEQLTSAIRGYIVPLDFPELNSMNVELFALCDKEGEQQRARRSGKIAGTAVE